MRGRTNEATDKTAENFFVTPVDVDICLGEPVLAVLLKSNLFTENLFVLFYLLPSVPTTHRGKLIYYRNLSERQVVRTELNWTAQPGGRPLGFPTQLSPRRNNNNKHKHCHNQPPACPLVRHRSSRAVILISTSRYRGRSLMALFSNSSRCRPLANLVRFWQSVKRGGEENLKW